MKLEINRDKYNSIRKSLAKSNAKWVELDGAIESIIEDVELRLKAFDEERAKDLGRVAADAQLSLVENIWLWDYSVDGELVIRVYFGDYCKEIPDIFVPFSQWIEDIGEEWEYSPEAVAILDKAIADLQAQRDIVAGKKDEQDPP